MTLLKTASVLFFSLVTSGGTAAIAQTYKTSVAFPLRLSVFNQHISLPAANRLANNLNPGIKIGTERYYSKKKRVDLLQSLDLGFARHRSLDNSFFVISEFGLRPKAGRFFAEVKLGPGFMLSHSKTPLYQYREHSWARTADREKKLLVSAGSGLGYTVKNLAVVLSWKCQLETPYLVNESAVLTRQQLEAGFQVAL